MNEFFPSQRAGLNEAHDLIAYKRATFSAIISALIVYSFFADLVYSHLTVWRNSVGLSVCCLIFASVWWLCILFTVLKVSFFPLCTLSSLLRSSECTWGANTHTHTYRIIKYTCGFDVNAQRPTCIPLTSTNTLPPEWIGTTPSNTEVHVHTHLTTGNSPQRCSQSTTWKKKAAI